MKKVILFVVAHEGFQHIEYHEPKKVVEAAGCTVVTASNKPGAAIAKDGSTAAVEIVLDQVNVEKYDGIIFIGGPGAMENLDNQTSYNVIKKAVQAQKLVGAICVSPRILATAGVLTDKKATGWDGDGKLAELFKEHGVNYVKQDVVTDGTIITATGPNAAKEFGKGIIALLSK